ncbi:MAG TPA: hypothetical protein VHC40_09770 [Rhizomicrobium sp.]|nr:hypothetical protein [Rhizomicrobium sp.]
MNMGKRRKYAAAAMASAAILSAAAAARGQSHPPPPANSTVPASVLDNLPNRTLSNGILSAKVYLPGEFGFYRGTRFDHAGLVTHVTYRGQDYSRYWFDKYATDIHDYTYYGDDGIVAAPASAVTGPVEEFDAIGFDDAKMGGTFLKPGVGMLKRNTDKYDHVLKYPVVNGGRRTTSATKTGITFRQVLTDKSGYGYDYVKTVRLTPGRPQMRIEHRLTNTGTKPIVTSVYCHNFLTLSPGNAGIALTAPFALKAERPLQPDLARVEGNTLRYVGQMKGQDMVTSPFGGFGGTAADYDFRVVDTRTGFGQRIRADQPIARINMWSVRSVFSWEPYVAISLKPGESKSWTYTYDFFGPGENAGEHAGEHE